MRVSPEIGSQTLCQAIHLLPSEAGVSLVFASPTLVSLDVWTPASFTELKTGVVCRTGGLCSWAETVLLMCEAGPGKRPRCHISLSPRLCRQMGDVTGGHRTKAAGSWGISTPSLNYTLTSHYACQRGPRGIQPGLISQTPKNKSNWHLRVLRREASPVRTLNHWHCGQERIFYCSSLWES